jgi:hypothetical protein
VQEYAVRKRVGLLGTLSAIALGIAMTGPPSAALALGSASTVEAGTTAAEDAEGARLAELCSAILATKTIGEFNQLPAAVAARDNAVDPCNELAVAHWNLLQGFGPNPASIGGDAGGYNFV